MWYESYKVIKEKDYIGLEYSEKNFGRKELRHLAYDSLLPHKHENVSVKINKAVIQHNDFANMIYDNWYPGKKTNNAECLWFRITRGTKHCSLWIYCTLYPTIGYNYSINYKSLWSIRWRYFPLPKEGDLRHLFIILS